VLGGVVALLAALAVFMSQASFEMWGGLMLIPVLAAVNIPLLLLFLRKRHRELIGIVIAGFFLKIIGTLLRFYVFSSVYSGVADSTYYYKNGSQLAAAVRAGRISWTEVLPLARELQFVIRLSGLVLTVTGPTRIGAFLVFGTMGFWGAVLLLVAGCRAIPSLATRRYAWLCMVVPTMVFWPSSLGKEAWLLLCIGAFSFGLAKLLTWDGTRLAVALMVLAGLGIGAVRLHLIVIFLVGATAAVVQRVAMPSERRASGNKFVALLIGAGATLGIGALGVAFVRRVNVNKNNGQGDILAVVDTALVRVETMSTAGGSAYSPINVRNPINWPYAIVRTLTRPLPIDVRSLSGLLPALEVLLFLVALVVGYRRLAGLGSKIRKAPYLTYSIVTMLMFGLIFSSIGNLGILVRQRSLVAGFMILLLCLPKATSRKERLEQRLDEAEAQRAAARGSAGGAAASRA